MLYRLFGSTGLRVSEIGFGAWGIGGAYGVVTRNDAIDALACAEDLGCNFVDSALVYGDAEVILGKFLRGRRDRWVIATKYSGQSEGMIRTVERQLSLLQVEAIDFYQVHWYPRGESERLFGEISRLKRDGKIRFAGVSLYSPIDVRDAVARSEIDGFQVEFSLINPNIFLDSQSRMVPEKGVVVRSVLGGGLLSGCYDVRSSFDDPIDQRRSWSRSRVELALNAVREFGFLEADAGSLRAAAIRYPLSFASVSTVIVGTKSVEQARANFGINSRPLSDNAMAQIAATQRRLHLRNAPWRRLVTAVKLACWPGSS